MTYRIGEVLRQARNEAGLSLRDLSRLTGLATGELSAIESGKRRADPAFSVVLRVARGIGIDLETVARRVEGGPAKGKARGDAQLARNLQKLDRARTEALRVVERIDAVADALTPPTLAQRKTKSPGDTPGAKPGKKRPRS